MKRKIGETYTFMDEEYILKEDVIVPEKDKQPFLLKLSVAAIVFIVVFGIPTWFVTVEDVTTFDVLDAFWYLLSFFVFIVVHELLHGITFAVGTKKGFKSIKFGVVLRSGVAYCISLVPVKVSRARLSLMMPIYLVCLPLYIYGVVVSDELIAILAVLFASGSVGDFYYMWKLRHTNKDLYMYEEMPTKTGYEIGYLLFEKK